MPRTSKPVNAQLIEYACDCGKGVFRLKISTPYTSDCRHTWLHACTACAKEVEFTVPYPLVEIQSGQRKREFMMVDAKPVATVERGG
jgi:hypothetical protein